MATDTLNRRIQWGARQPRKRLFVFQEADYVMFELMDRHGWLPSNYLIEGTRHLPGDESQTKNRLTELYHGSLLQGHFLKRHSAQFAQFNAHARHVVTNVASRAKALEALGRRAAVPPTNSTWFVHQLFQGCVGTSLELCVPHGFRYVSRSELLADDRCNDAKAAKNPMSVPIGAKTLTPDDMFALERDGLRRYFFIEIDRATESMNGESGATYFASKLAAYSALFRSGALHDRFGFKRPNLLVVTTNAARARKINSYFGEFNASLHERLFVTVEPSFGPNWRVPNTLLRHLYQEPWLTPSGERRISA